MSDVIEVMVEEWFESEAIPPDHNTHEDRMKAALRAAEQAGWRLVPVEPDRNMKLAVSPWIPLSQRRNVIRSAIQAAPRPWDDT